MDIFEYFASIFECFISDLRLQDFDVWSSHADVIREIPEALFSRAEWDEFLSYLFSKPLSFSSIDEAKSYLLLDHTSASIGHLSPQ